jgi:hypothetical protein
VLFSRADVAHFINRYFEPVWQAVRPVPLVRIDFGNGTVVTRTLHGNIATYLCTAEGQVLDILPGIYTPEVYRDRLSQFRLLANYVDQLGPEKRAERLHAYHQGQGDALRHNAPPPVFVNMDVSKVSIEDRLKAVLVSGNGPARGAVAAAPGEGKTTENPRLAAAEDLASWKLLAEDTRLNETTRRRHIHEWLASAGLVRPEQVTKRLYKEVLHADLDDPYLGLGSSLFANDPFRDQPAP